MLPIMQGSVGYQGMRVLKSCVAAHRGRFRGILCYPVDEHGVMIGCNPRETAEVLSSLRKEIEPQRRTLKGGADI